MKLISREEINDELWNDCVSNSVNSLVYGYTWYLDSLVSSWTAYVWEKNGIYEAVFPIPWKRKAGFKYVYPPFFIQQLGVFSRNGNVEFFTKMAVSAVQNKFKFVEMYLNHSSGKRGQQRDNFVLDLRVGLDEIRLGYSGNHKRNIQKAKKNAVEIVEGIEVEDVVKLFKSDRGATISALKEYDYDCFTTLIKEAEKHIKVLVVGVRSEDELVSGGVFLEDRNRVVFIFSGNSEKGKELGGLFLILDKVLEMYAGKDVLFDFEGSMNEGLARFYKGFGAQLQPYWFVRKNNLPLILKWVKK